MTARYRIATAQDAERLVVLFHDCFCETFGDLYEPRDLALFLDGQTAELWREQLESENFAVWVVEDGNEIGGYIKLGPVKLPVSPRGKAIELWQLYLLKPWHGSGAARELMDWGIAEARRRHAEEMYLSVFTNNHRARSFYARYGFEEIGPYAFMVGNQADEDIIMRLAL